MDKYAGLNDSMREYEGRLTDLDTEEEKLTKETKVKPDGDITSVEATLSDLDERIKGLGADLAVISGTSDDATKKDELQQEIEGLKNQSRGLESDIFSREKNLTEIKRGILELEREIKKAAETRVGVTPGAVHVTKEIEGLNRSISDHEESKNKIIREITKLDSELGIGEVPLVEEANKPRKGPIGIVPGEMEVSDLDKRGALLEERLEVAQDRLGRIAEKLWPIYEEHDENIQEILDDSDSMFYIYESSFDSALITLHEINIEFLEYEQVKQAVKGQWNDTDTENNSKEIKSMEEKIHESRDRLDKLLEGEGILEPDDISLQYREDLKYYGRWTVKKFKEGYIVERGGKRIEKRGHELANKLDALYAKKARLESAPWATGINESAASKNREDIAKNEEPRNEQEEDKRKLEALVDELDTVKERLRVLKEEGEKALKAEKGLKKTQEERDKISEQKTTLENRQRELQGALYKLTQEIGKIKEAKESPTKEPTKIKIPEIEIPTGETKEPEPVKNTIKSILELPGDHSVKIADEPIFGLVEELSKIKSDIREPEDVRVLEALGELENSVGELSRVDSLEDARNKLEVARNKIQEIQSIEVVDRVSSGLQKVEDALDSIENKQQVDRVVVVDDAVRGCDADLKKLRDKFKIKIICSLDNLFYYRLLYIIFCPTSYFY